MVDDVEQIRSLIHEYAFRLDAGDFDGVCALFEHAELGSSTVDVRVQGTEGARFFYSGVILYDDGTPCTQHQMTNVTVRLGDDGVSATARTYFTVLQAAPGFPLQPIITGHYLDRFEKVDGTWRFAERVFVPGLIGDLSRHMQPGWLPEPP